MYNLSGGFKAWQGQAAFGGEEQGLELFTGHESPEKMLTVAYSLEEGLRDFYLSMIPKVVNNAAKNLFEKLSEIELKHQDRLFDMYARLSGKTTTREEFEKGAVIRAAEAGLTTEQYTSLFQPDWESVVDIIGLAMSIEAQALDLYQRAAGRSSDPQSKRALMQIADEERVHLSELGKLIDNI